jgi:hypothetical protein
MQKWNFLKFEKFIEHVRFEYDNDQMLMILISMLKRW